MSKRKLLLADDSETVQKVVNLTFELEGIEVITFGDGDSAMQEFSSVAPDVVLADVNMPGMSGYDICQNIKGNEATKDTPVILLVGSFEPFDEEKAMQVGADDYLTKPFQSIRQLVSKVNELLSPENAGATDIESFHDTLRMEENPYYESEFSDPGMDDEMILTNHIAGRTVDETAKFQTKTDFRDKVSGASEETQTVDDWQNDYSSEQSPGTSKQTVYEIADEQTAGQFNEETEDFAANDFQVSDEPASDEADIVSEAGLDSVVTNFETEEALEFNERVSEIKAEEELGIQPDDIDHFYKEPDYDDEDLLETEDFPADSEYEEHRAGENLPADSETNEDENLEEKEIKMEQSQMSSPVPVLDFDEFDLLEIAYPDEITTSSAEPVSEPEMVQHEIESKSQTEENSAEQVKSEVSEQLSGVNLSPEDIEAIAEKVVEKLSARLKE